VGEATVRAVRNLLVSLCLLLGFFAAALANAAPERDHSDAEEQRARALFEHGLSQFNHGRYPEAIEAFQKAYDLSQAPGLLFNLGLAYRRAGDCAHAVHFYEEYLRLEADVPNRGELEGRLTELRRCAGRTLSPPDAQVAPPPETHAVLEAQAGQVPRAPGRTSRWVGLSLAGAGALLLITGAYFGVQAQDASDELDRLNRTGGMGLQSRRIIEDGESAATTANVSFILGGAAALAGAIVYYVGSRERGETSSSAWVSPLPQGLVLGWAWSR
jgi:tetratricopeptide (TPR) repeat protein